jgi:hypothetical protein
MIEAMMDVSGWQDYIGTGNTVQKLAAADLPNHKIAYLAALEKRNSRYDAFIHLSHPVSLNGLLCEPPQHVGVFNSASLLAPTKQGLTRLRTSLSVCVFTVDFLVNSLCAIVAGLLFRVGLIPRLERPLAADERR